MTRRDEKTYTRDAVRLKEDMSTKNVLLALVQHSQCEGGHADHRLTMVVVVVAVGTFAR